VSLPFHGHLGGQLALGFTAWDQDVSGKTTDEFLGTFASLNPCYPIIAYKELGPLCPESRLSLRVAGVEPFFRYSLKLHRSTM
jgi:hypothetical protein